MLKDLRLKLCVGAVTLFTCQMGMAQEPPEYLKFDYSVYPTRNNPVVEKDDAQMSYVPSECINATGEVNGKDRVSCDFWWEEYLDISEEEKAHWVTHVGADFQIAPNANQGEGYPIKSFAFGRVCGAKSNGTRTDSSYLSIEYLLNSGDAVIGNFLHLRDDSIVSRFVDSELVTNCSGDQHLGYVTKLENIAREGNTGTFAPEYSSDRTHLHIEFSNKGGNSRWVTSNRACIGASCPSSERNTEYDLDGLSAYHEFSDVEDGNSQKHVANKIVWYNPDRIFKNKKALVPVLRTISNEAVISAYSNQDFVGSLNLVRSERLNGADLGLYYIKKSDARVNSRNSLNAVNDLGSEAAFFKFNYIPRNSVQSSISLPVGDYLFFAAIDVTEAWTKGYPVDFSVISESEIILDNDQYALSLGNNTAVDITGPFGVSPGYFLTSLVSQGINDENTEDLSAVWLPRRQGKFVVSVSVPEHVESGEYYYQVCPSGIVSECEVAILDVTEASSKSSRWVKLRNLQGDVKSFSFSNTGYVKIMSRNFGNSDEVFVDGVRFSYSNKEKFALRRILRVEESALNKILGFYMEGNTNSTIVFDQSFYQMSEVTLNSVPYIRIAGGENLAHIDTRNHQVVDLNCSFDSQLWYEDPIAYLVSIGVVLCEDGVQ